MTWNIHTVAVTGTTIAMFAVHTMPHEFILTVANSPLLESSTRKNVCMSASHTHFDRIAVLLFFQLFLSSFSAYFSFLLFSALYKQSMYMFTPMSMYMFLFSALWAVAPNKLTNARFMPWLKNSEQNCVLIMLKKRFRKKKTNSVLWI